MAAPRVASTGGYLVSQMLMFWPERALAGASRSSSGTLLASLARHQLLQKPLILDVSRRFSTAAAASGYSNKSYRSNRKSSIIHGVGYHEYSTSSSRSASSSSSNLTSASTVTNKADISPEGKQRKHVCTLPHFRRNSMQMQSPPEGTATQQPTTGKPRRR